VGFTRQFAFSMVDAVFHADLSKSDHMHELLALSVIFYAGFLKKMTTYVYGDYSATYRRLVFCIDTIQLI